MTGKVHSNVCRYCKVTSLGIASTIPVLFVQKPVQVSTTNAGVHFIRDLSNPSLTSKAKLPYLDVLI